MLERLVVVHYDFVHFLRPGDAGIVEGHPRLGPQRGRPVLGRRLGGAGDSTTPALLGSGLLLVLAVRDQLETVPRGILQRGRGCGRRRLLR
jgi:hypothetical protein